VLGQRVAQLRRPGELAVAEARVRQLRQRPPLGPSPGPAREQREVRGAGEEIDRGAGSRRRAARLLGRGAARTPAPAATAAIASRTSAASPDEGGSATAGATRVPDPWLETT
jgi:hypothetical protein